MGFRIAVLYLGVAFERWEFSLHAFLVPLPTSLVVNFESWGESGFTVMGFTVMHGNSHCGLDLGAGACCQCRLRSNLVLSCGGGVSVVCKFVIGRLAASQVDFAD